MRDEDVSPHILFVSPFFHPEPISTGAYNSHLVESLASLGARVTVICSYPFYPNWVVEPVPDELSGVCVVRGGRGLHYPKSQVLRRAILEWWFSRHVRNAVRSVDEDVSLVVEVFPPNLYSRSLDRSFVGVPKIGIVHDLQGVLAGGGTIWQRKAIRQIVEHVEEKALRSCDHLIFLSHEMLNSAVSQYGLDESGCSVSYPFHTLDRAAVNVQSVSALQEVQKSRYSLVYSGALGEKQNPQLLAQFMHQFAVSMPEFDAYVFSSGPIFESLRAKYRDRGSPLRFRDLVPLSDLPALLRSSTIQVVPQLPGSSRGAFPSKLANLIAAGVPVFAITDEGSELQNLVQNYSRGLAVTSWETHVLLGQLAEFATDMTSKAPRERPSSEDAGLIQKFDPKHLAKTLLDRVFESPYTEA